MSRSRNFGELRFDPLPGPAVKARLIILLCGQEGDEPEQRREGERSGTLI